MHISVIVCTYNRCSFLAGTLSSLLSQDFPHDEYEIIVVDNNSSDGTRQIVNEAAKETLVDVRCVPEKRQGLSYARNSGIGNATGRIVAFTDDDALPCKEWLKEIARTFETVKPAPGCVGGKVVPLWGTCKPEWLSDSLLTYLSILDLGESPRRLSDNEFVAGTNMAFLRQSLEETGLFEVRLGRKIKSLLSGEENLLLRQMRSIGEHVYYQPRAVVEHYIPEERLERKWFLRRAFNQGVSDYRIRKLMPIHASGNYNTINSFQVIKRIFMANYHMAFGNSRERVNAMVYLTTLFGYACAVIYDH